MQPGTKIRLIGITLKGKNRIREHGDLWEVIRIENMKDGTKAFIKSCESEIESIRDWRWIKPTNDPNFEIVEELK